MQSLLDRVASPAEPAFRLAWIAVTEGQANLCLEEPALVSSQPLGRQTKQFVVLVPGVVHGRLVRDGNRRMQRQPT